MKPKWLALLALVCVVLVTFAMLGLWQLNVARDKGHAEALERAAALPSVQLTQALPPHTPMTSDLAGRSVTVSGTYDAGREIVVTDRRLGERTGYWVVTPLVVDGTQARLAVIRGFTTDPAAVPTPSAGPVSLAGMLAPGEAAPDRPVALPPGQMQSVDLAVLVNDWPGELYNAMLFPTSQTPPAQATSALAHIPPPDLLAEGMSWRNLAYALQWWIFALFALYMWWRMVREEHDRLALTAAGPDRASGAEPDRASGAEPDRASGADTPPTSAGGLR